MSATIETLLDEDRHFAPAAAFKSEANMSDPAVYERALADPQSFWEDWARKLDWSQPWHTVLEWERPFAKWFVGGQLNACHNCVDRHVLAGRGDNVAFIAEGEPGDVRTFTYALVQEEVSRVANALKELGVRKGDRVCVYMPMIPELPLA